MSFYRPMTLVAGLALAGALGACAEDGSASGTTYQVKAGDSSCEVSDTELAAGEATFEVENVGSDVTEVYVYGKNGDDFTKIMGERENIGPGTSQSFQVTLPAGEYQVACKPGMTGDGIRTNVTVTGEGGSAAESEASYDREVEFEIEDGGTVKPPAELDATVGEKLEFKLENEADAEYYLELLDPQGEELGEAEAHAGTGAEFVAELTHAGTYQVKVFEDGKESAAETFPLEVTE